jgi:hypothetical protein
VAALLIHTDIIRSRVAMVPDLVRMAIDITSRTNLIEIMVNIANMGMIAEIMVMVSIGDMIMIDSVAFMATRPVKKLGCKPI